MPVIRYFLVEQVRQVKVSCDSPEQAAVLATRVFDGEANIPLGVGSVVAPVKVIDLHVTENR